MALLTAADVLLWAPQATGQDEKILDAVAEATAMADEFCDRVLESASQDEYFSPLSRAETVSVKAFPVTAVSAITEGSSGTSPTALTVTTNYIYDPTTGVFTRVAAYWDSGPRAVRVQYTGGYTSATLPRGLKSALLQLTAWVIGNRGNVGVASGSVDGVSQTFQQMIGNMPASQAHSFYPFRRLSAG